MCTTHLGVHVIITIFHTSITMAINCAVLAHTNQEETVAIQVVCSYCIECFSTACFLSLYIANIFIMEVINQDATIFNNKKILR